MAHLGTKAEEFIPPLDGMITGQLWFPFSGGAVSFDAEFNNQTSDDMGVMPTRVWSTIPEVVPPTAGDGGSAGFSVG